MKSIRLHLIVYAFDFATCRPTSLRLLCVLNKEILLAKREYTLRLANAMANPSVCLSVVTRL